MKVYQNPFQQRVYEQLCAQKEKEQAVCLHHFFAAPDEGKLLCVRCQLILEPLPMLDMPNVYDPAIRYELPEP
jgi:hypothetical protein